MDVVLALEDPHRLAAVRRIGLTDGEEAFDRLARLAARLVGAEVAFVGIVDGEQELFAGAVGLPDQLAEARRFPLHLGVCRHVVERGTSVLVSDARRDPVLVTSPLLAHYPTFAYAGLPLRVGGEVVGALCVVEPRARRWSESDRTLLEDVAEVVEDGLVRRGDWRAADGLRRALATGLPALEEEAAAQAAIARVATAVARARDLGRLAPLVAHEVSCLLGAAVGLVVSSGAEGELAEAGRWAAKDADVTAVSARTRAAWPQLGGGDAVHDAGYAAAPVRRAGRVWGAVAAAAAADDVLAWEAPVRLARVAELLGVALGNAEARDRLAARAVTDPLTGLSNRRAFERRLAEELAGARRAARPLSVLLFDLDRLKAINDTLGHEAGDRALVHVADRAKRAVRRGELLARIGGDEFAVVAPGADAREARTLAGRLLARTGGVRVSVGISEARAKDGATAVLAAADRALYAAKRRGGNRVEG